MQQEVLISEAMSLINQAQAEEGFGRPAGARAHLVKLCELLTDNISLVSPGDTELEEKLNPDE